LSSDIGVGNTLGFQHLARFIRRGDFQRKLLEYAPDAAHLVRIGFGQFAISALLATIAYWFYNFVGFNLP
jgi:hypothetical protein